MHNQRIWRWIIGAAAALGLLGVLVLTRVGDASPRGVQLLVEQTANGISYAAAFDTVQQRVDGRVSYDYISAEGVKAYLDFNRSAAQQIAARPSSPVRINIVFSRPMSQAEFEQFVQSYQLTVHHYTIRAVESDGARVTIFGGPENGQLIPAAILDSVSADIKTRNAADIKGWIETEVTTTPDHLQKMLDDPAVFTTEAAYTLIYDSLTAERLTQAGASAATLQAIQANTDRTVQITHPSLYWSLEDLGMVPTQ